MSCGYTAALIGWSPSGHRVSGGSGVLGCGLALFMQVADDADFSPDVRVLQRLRCLLVTWHLHYISTCRSNFFIFLSFLVYLVYLYSLGFFLSLA